MKPTRLDNGNLLVPVRLEGPNGELGDGLQEIGPDHPEWDEWQWEVEVDEL